MLNRMCGRSIGSSVQQQRFCSRVNLQKRTFNFSWALQTATNTHLSSFGPSIAPANWTINSTHSPLSVRRVLPARLSKWDRSHGFVYMPLRFNRIYALRFIPHTSMCCCCQNITSNLFTCSLAVPTTFRLIHKLTVIGISSNSRKMVKKKIDNRIRVMIENGVKLGHRSMFIIVGDKGRDQVSNNFILILWPECIDIAELQLLKL